MHAVPVHTDGVVCLSIIPFLFVDVEVVIVVVGHFHLVLERRVLCRYIYSAELKKEAFRSEADGGTRLI